MAAAPDPKNADVAGAGLIFKACDILDLVGREPGRLAIRDLMRRAGLPKSTVYRIVAALEARGLLRNDRRTQTLSLGFHLLDLAQNVWATPDLVVGAAPELRRLSEMTGETAYLAALSGHSAIVLARSLGAHEDSSMSELGVLRPLHATSQGKAMLAHVPQKQADQLIGELSFEALTSHTIVNPEVLRHRLEIIRQRGFSLDDQELMEGVRCVGAPVIDTRGQCVGAISVTGPFYRMTLERIEQLGPELIAAARRIGENLSAQGGHAEPAHAADFAVIGDVSFVSAAPFWSVERGALYWADRLAPSVFTLEAGGAPRLLARMAYPIDALGPAPRGGLDVVCEDGWRHLGADGAAVIVAPPAGAKIAALRMGADGRRWAALVEGGTTRIGYFDARQAFHALWSLSGGVHDLALDARTGRLFAADGERGVVYEYQEGRAAPHVLARIPRGSGEPRGLALDGEGRLWAALWDGWSVARFDEFGEIDRIVGLPAPRPTGLAFGGPGLKTLYVTTARLGLTREILENAPLSGRLLAYQLT